MPPLRFAPYRDIADRIAERLVAARASADPLDPWAEEVIVPSRGVAAAIASALLEQLPNGFAGLRIQTLEDLAQRLLDGSGRTRRAATDAERRLAMRAAVRASDHPMMEGRGVAAMLERAYRDVRDSGLTLSELTRRVSGARLRNRSRTNAILAAWTDYERLIAQLDAVDAADRLASAASLISASVKPQILAGFYDMTGAQLRLVEALLDAGRVSEVHVPTDMPFAQPLVQALARHCDISRDQPIAVPAAHLTAAQYDSRFAELRGVCSAIEALLAAGTPPRQIGIVARSLEPYDVRLLNRFAREHGFRTTLPDDVALIAHRIGRGAVTLLRLREHGFPRADVLELVRDGLRTKTRLRVDAVDAATRRARIAGGTSEELRKIGSKSREVDDYIALVAELEELTSRLDLDFFRRLGSMFRIETDLDLAAAERLDAIGDTFRRTAVWRRDIDVHTMIDAVEQETLTCPAHDEGPVVWAGELPRFRGRSFGHLFVVRMQDDVFPQRRTEDPLLPDSDRQAMGVRTIGDGREEESLLFSLVAAAAAEVHFSFASGDGFGRVLRPSRFLRGIESATPHTSSRNRSASTNHRRQLQLLSRAGTASEFDGYLGTLSEHLHEKLRSLSPTQLEDFGECPQKFLLKHLLGVRDIDEPEREIQINPRDKGTIDHTILERFYRATSDGDLDRAAAALPELPDDLRDRLDGIVEAEFDALETNYPPFNRTMREIERRATRRLLAEFLVRDIADLDTQQLRPTRFEYRFGEKHADRADEPRPFIVRTGEAEIRVEGTIDRIDTDGQRYRIVDYKSGKAGRHENLGDKIDRGVRLQLALYSMAVAEFFSVAPENVSATIKPLAETDKKPEKFTFALHEKREGLLETLQIFMRSILEGSFPAFPSENSDFDSCRYCPVSHSCRTRHDSDERHAMAQHGDARTLLASRRTD